MLAKNSSRRFSPQFFPRVAFSLSLVVAPQLALSQSSWTAGNGLWSNAGNWDAAPLANTDVFINLPGPVTVTYDSGSLNVDQLTLTAPNVLSISAGTLSINSLGGATSVNSGSIDVGGTGTLNILGDTLNNTGGSLIASSGGEVLSSGGRITGGVVGSSGTGRFFTSAASTNIFENVELTGSLDLATTNAAVSIENGMTLNGTVNVNSNSVFASRGSNVIGGNGDIVFGATGSANRFILDGNGTTTLGSGVTVRGENGTIGNVAFIGGVQNLVVDGRVSADVAGGLISLATSAVTNNGVLDAQNGGQLAINIGVDNSAGQINVGTGSIVKLGGVTVIGGQINTSGTGVLQTSAAASNFLDGVAVQGNVDLASANSHLRVQNNLDLDGQIDLNANSVLAFNGTNNITGNATIVLGDTGPSNRIALDGNGITTLGADSVIRGENGTIGAQVSVGGTQTLVADGRVSADVSGGTITIAESSVQNNGLLEAQNGGTLNLTSAVSNGPSGEIRSGVGSSVIQSGITISGGTITTTGDGQYRATNNGANFLDGVTVNGNIDLASATAQLRVVNDLTLNGQVEINNNSVFSFQGDNVLDGSANIVLGNTGGSNRLILDGDGTTTFGSNVVVEGENGTIGGQIYVAGTQMLDLNGRISANVNGGLISIVDSIVNNNGSLEALNGGQLTLFSAVNNGSGGEIVAGTGSTVLQSGITITGGEISTAGTGVLRASANSANFLDGVTVQGNIDLASATGIETITNNLVLNGQIDINNNSVLGFRGDNVVSGTGQIVLGDTGGSNRLILDGNGTTTIGSNIVIRGEDGTIGNQLFVAGTQILDLDGRISADVTGGTLAIFDSVVNNSGILEAQNGGQLTLSSAVINDPGGQILAGNASTVLQNNVRITGGTLDSVGTGAVRVSGAGGNTLDSVTLNGTLDMATGFGQEKIENGLMLNGQINVNSNSVLNSNGSNLIDGTGMIVFGSTGASNRLILDGAGTTTIGSSITVRGQNATIGNQLSVAGVQTLVNHGLITADVATGVFNFNESNVNNNGTLQARNGGELRFNVAVDNQGLVEALDGSAVTYNASATTVNNMAGNLVGGVWRAEDTGSGATITLRGADITTNNADVTLKGANSLIQVLTTSIDTTLDTNNGSLRLQDGRVFNATANGGNFTNTGALEVTDSTFTASTLVSDGQINSFGNSVVTTDTGNQVMGAGQVSSSFGTLEVTRGVNMGIGSSLTSNAGAAVDLSSATQASLVDTLNNNGSLDLGARNIVVTKDYTNANFGAGNAFDPRENISGTGLIIGNNASQTITGDVTNTGSNTFLLDLGNVRGGTSAVADFQVANNGTGADIRGAVQTTANGGNLSDGRLSGSGAIASNFGPVAAGADTGNLSVTFNASSGGSLAGQSLAVVSNFDNVATQIINLTGMATTLAQGSATPNSNPVDLGNFRVGGAAVSQDFTVENTSAAASSTERLGIASVGTTGNFSGSNGLGGGFIAGGSSQAAAVSVAVNGGVAGINTGSVAVQYSTNGELIDAGFTNMNANAETINLQATGFNAAVGSAAPAPTANLGNVRIGGSLDQSFTITNTAGPGTFSEDLAAAFGASTGQASNNGGAVLGLLAGGSNGAAMSASLDTSTAGAKSGSVTIDYTTTGEVGGVSNGLGSANAGSEVVALSGNVYQTAIGQLNNTSLNFGTVQVGQVVNQSLDLENIATGAAGHVEDLNVRFGATSGSSNPGLISGAGSIAGLAAGASNSSALVVSVDTSAAAVVNGQIAVDYFSAGTVNGVNIVGLSEVSAGSDAFSVLGTIQTGGQVVDQANPSIANPVIALGNVRIGNASATDVVEITNVATGNMQAALNASITGNSPVTASGSFTLLAPGATNNSSLQVGLNTSVAGAINGTADIALVSDASNIGNCAPNCALSLGTQSVAVTGNVFRLATGEATPNPVALGNFRLGSGAPSADLAVSNTAAADGSSEQLGIASVASGSGLFTASNNLGATRINAGASSAGAVSVGLGAGLAAGVNNGSVDIQYVSDGAASGTGAAINSNSESVAVSAVGYRVANPLLNTGSITLAARVGDALPGPVSVSVSNVSPDVFTEGLDASFGPVSAGFSSTGSVVNLAANSSNNGDLQVGLLSTATSQNITGSVDVNFVSSGAGTTGAADLAVGSAAVSLGAKVYEAADAAVVTTTVDFGTVRVGDVGVGTQVIRQIDNVASGVLVDDLQGSFGSVAAGFSADAGALSGPGVASGGNTDLTFGIDTSAAGVFSGTASLGLSSHNDDLADLNLASETFNLTGTVNNLAKPTFALTSGDATLTGGGTLYNLVFDTVLDTDNSFLMADLSVINDVLGPADMLDGFFDISSTGVFSALGFTPIDDLVAGAAHSGLMVGFDTSTQSPGAFMASIFFDPSSVFAGLADVNLQMIELRISGLIRQAGGSVPVPGTLLLFVGPMLFLVYGVTRRRRTDQAA